MPAAKLYGPGTGAILDEMECTGLEENLLECSYIRDGSNCKHSEDVGVRCFKSKMCMELFQAYNSIMIVVIFQDYVKMEKLGCLLLVILI